MEFSILLNSILPTIFSLSFIGLSVYWLGRFYTIYYPGKTTKEQKYEYGILFAVKFVFTPLAFCLVLCFLVFEYLSKISTEIGLISLLFYIIVIFSLLNDVSTISLNYEKKPMKHIRKKKINKISKKLAIWAYALILFGSLEITHLYIIMSSTTNDLLDLMSLLGQITFIMLTFLMISIIAALEGYSKSTFKKSRILKTDGTELKGYILNHDEYLTLYDGQKIKKVKDACISEIEPMK